MASSRCSWSTLNIIYKDLSHNLEALLNKGWIVVHLLKCTTAPMYHCSGSWVEWHILVEVFWLFFVTIKNFSWTIRTPVSTHATWKWPCPIARLIGRRMPSAKISAPPPFAARKSRLLRFRSKLDCLGALRPPFTNPGHKSGVTPQKMAWWRDSHVNISMFTRKTILLK